MLDLRNINVRYATSAGIVQAVRDLSLQVQAGECLAVVGESGAGKTQTFLAALGLLNDTAKVTGAAYLHGTDLLQLGAKELNKIRGPQIGFIFQNPGQSLTPHLRIRTQLSEPLILHRRISKRKAWQTALNFLTRLDVPNAARVLDQFPHELSGGMRQRAALAMALICEPALLIADEPTTALDVISQAQMLRLLIELRRERGMTLVLITHDLAVAANTADRVAVMDQGQVVEIAPTSTIFSEPQHPKTRALLDDAKRLRIAAPNSTTDTVINSGDALNICGLTVSYQQHNGVLFNRKPPIRALNEVTLTIRTPEAVGVIGASGSGKTTLASTIAGLLTPSAGKIAWLGDGTLARKDVQLIFQDAVASLNPRMRVRDIICEPLVINQTKNPLATSTEKAITALTDVGLKEEILDRYPHEISTGQCQRVAIARALIVEPKILICDEPISSLDVSTQLEILKLLRELKNQKHISILFISHDLSAIKHICDKVAVIYRGEIIEAGSTHTIFNSPAHPYTKALLDATPILRSAPSPINA